MHYANYNQNDKIRVFIQEHIHVDVIVDSEQQSILRLPLLESSQTLLVTMVYTKYDEQ